MDLALGQDYDLAKYWRKFWIGIGASIALVVLSLAFNAPDVRPGFGLEPLLFIVDPIRAAVDTLSILFVIALFVERANEIFVGSTRVVARKQAELEIKTMEDNAAQNAGVGPEHHAITLAKNTLLTYRAGTRILTITFSVIISTLLALGGVRALSPLLEVQFDALALTQWFILQAADIVVTVAIISGGSNGVHRMISTIVDQFPTKAGSTDAQTSPTT